jgi:hypothetical protein
MEKANYLNAGEHGYGVDAVEQPCCSGRNQDPGGDAKITCRR